ncbi:MAG: hypothetical protein JOZ02_11435 [Acidobacteria bacterium]|nr:hypothetical protein [Acidobacteriota bacterium]
MKKRRTEIIVETHELLTVRVFDAPAPAWCADCGGASRLLPPREAARFCRVSTRAIYGWVGAQRVHFKETAGGALLVCLNSCLEGGEK